MKNRLSNPKPQYPKWNIKWEPGFLLLNGDFGKLEEDSEMDV